MFIFVNVQEFLSLIPQIVYFQHDSFSAVMGSSGAGLTARSGQA
jgi:hypothetical protein